ncbi:MAG: hypothetical protein ABJA18_10365 [bacterium]
MLVGIAIIAATVSVRVFQVMAASDTTANATKRAPVHPVALPFFNVGRIDLNSPLMAYLAPMAPSTLALTGTKSIPGDYATLGLYLCGCGSSGTGLATRGRKLSAGAAGVESGICADAILRLRRDANASPDTDFSGYNFWLAKLDSFNGNFREAEMVKAFLVSGEYRGRFPR